jgi:hypothetical protein
MSDEIDKIQKAVDVMHSVCISEKLSYTIEFVPTKKMYRMRFMGKSWLNESMFEVYKEAIMLIAAVYGIKNQRKEEPKNGIRPTASDSDMSTVITIDFDDILI